jgi:hypothetical protein
MAACKSATLAKEPRRTALAVSSPNQRSTSTRAWSGGFRYSPTTSVSFSINRASRDGLKLLTRCGFKLWLRQMVLTVDLLTPCACAICRQLHCVIASGLVNSVAWTIALILRAE